MVEIGTFSGESWTRLAGPPQSGPERAVQVDLNNVDSVATTIEVEVHQDGVSSRVFRDELTVDESFPLYVVLAPGMELRGKLSAAMTTTEPSWRVSFADQVVR